MTLMLSLFVGAGLGAALGYFGRCSTGACPLTATPWRGALYGAVLGLLFHSVYARSTPTASIDSHSNLQLVNEQQFDAELAQAKVPVVVDFYATWCGPCKRLSPIMNELAAAHTNEFKFLRVDVDQSARLAERYQIEGVPTVLFFSHGTVVDRVVGLESRESLEGRLSGLAEKGRSLAASEVAPVPFPK